MNYQTLQNLYSSLINNPLAPQNYRRLQDHYNKDGDIDAAKVFQHVLKVKFDVNLPDSNEE